MKNLRLLLAIVTILVATLACNAAGKAPAPTQATATLSSPAQTQAPAPTQAPAATSQPTTAPAATIPAGKPITIGGISFVLSDQIASDVSSQTTTELELPYINGPADLPSHTVLTLNNDNLQGTQVTPKISVFRLAEYTGYGDMAAGTAAALQSPYTDGQPIPAGLKCVLCSQAHSLTFQNGHGIRVLEQYDTAPVPFNNQKLFYYFRGVTDDGQYFVQVELPIQASFLPADDNPNTPLPAGCVPFDANNLSAYQAAVRQKLDGAVPGTFTPTFEQLDALVQSLLVKGM